MVPICEDIISVARKFFFCLRLFGPTHGPFLDLPMVPDLKLWLGLATGTHQLCASSDTVFAPENGTTGMTG